MDSTILSKVRVEVTVDEDNNSDEMYGALTDVTGTIYHTDNVKSIGRIVGILVDRQAIPARAFWETFDDHSAVMEWVGGSLMENRHGRTTLQSLCSHDDPEFAFLYISNFTIDDPTYSSNSDISTAALHKFLHDPSHIKGTCDYDDIWKVSSAAYVLPPASKNDAATGKRKRDTHCEAAEPFLRNGFFQDKALIRKDPDNVRMLVASHGHWRKSRCMPRSQAQVASISLIEHRSRSAALTGKDLEIVQAVRHVCAPVPGVMEHNLSLIMQGLATDRTPENTTTPAQLTSLRATLNHLVESGGSISRSSTAMHVACERNKPKVVELLLQLDGASVQCVDNDDTALTPLMVAAKNATGRLSINGIDDTQVVDLLLAAGANKSSTDSSGMTAYGYFCKGSKPYFSLGVHHHRRGTLIALESKLCPPGGPTEVDLAGGKGYATGLVDYGPEDEEADREMGRFVDDDGDY